MTSEATTDINVIKTQTNAAVKRAATNHDREECVSVILRTC